MTTKVCMTVDVEDFYDGMAELGERRSLARWRHAVVSPVCPRFSRPTGEAVVTLFVVGNYADRVQSDLAGLIDRGSRGRMSRTGPRSPSGRSEDAGAVVAEGAGDDRRPVPETGVGLPVTPVRRPPSRLDSRSIATRWRKPASTTCPIEVSWARSRRCGSFPCSPAEAFHWEEAATSECCPLPPSSAVVGTSPEPVVLYYHSYDFGATLPPMSSIRSIALAKQLLGRDRVAGLFSRLLQRYGSEACGRIA